MSKRRPSSPAPDVSYIGGCMVAFNSRRRLWAVIRRGEIIAEAPTKADAELIAQPGSLWAGSTHRETAKEG